jgi:hypothetical protein
MSKNNKLKKLKKYYVTNGFNKKIFMKKSAEEAAISMISYITESSDKDEHFELYPFSVVSECGFLQDILAENNFEEIDNCLAVKTSDIMKKLGREDIAEDMLDFENTLPDQMKELLKHMSK